MSYRYAQAVKIVCDAPDCTTETGDLSEFAFFLDDGSADDDWSYSDGVQTKAGKHYCPEHRPDECAGCGELRGDVELVNDEPNDEGDWWCPKCWAEEQVNRG